MLPLILVAGPTASGKGAPALALAAALGGTIVNADSMQVYRDLRVLTARPGPAEEARAPHRLYGVLDAAEACSAGRWRTLALEAVAEARAADRVPILVGGTGLYFEALLRGLAALPPIPAAARAAARALHAELGAAAFHARLAALDPESASRLAPADTQRVLRAFEVANATGTALPEWQRRQPPGELGAVAALVLLPPRAALYAACDARFAAMLDNGAVEEARAFLARGLAPELPAMKAVGLREIAAMLAGRLSPADGIAAAQQATRNYAKRQYTWFRNRLTARDGVRRLDLGAQFSESILPEILSFIRQ